MLGLVWINYFLVLIAKFMYLEFWNLNIYKMDQFELPIYFLYVLQFDDEWKQNFIYLVYMGEVLIKKNKLNFGFEIINSVDQN